jgi:hypothetical protein
VTHLRADGVTDTYTLIDAALLERSGTVVETPDCKHTDFGPHITQVFDEQLNRHVFAFHSHIRQDDDRCINTDRQRVEIKTYDRSPQELLGYNGDFVTYSWNFKLDAGFLPPYSFCHIHQLKAVGGDESMPIITVSLRKSTPNVLQLLQYDSKGSLLFLKEEPLTKFTGRWVHAESEVVYGHHGAYNMTFTDYATKEVLLHYSSNDIDFWRNDTTTVSSFVRPKWGVYRSVQEAVLSRNETVLFDDFCIGKGEVDRCFERSEFVEDTTVGPSSVQTFLPTATTSSPNSAAISTVDKFILSFAILFFSTLLAK